MPSKNKVFVRLTSRVTVEQKKFIASTAKKHKMSEGDVVRAAITSAMSTPNAVGPKR